MPGVTLHFVFADRALGAWRKRSSAPPFDLDDSAALNAFYHGAVGPDLGYFPGGDRILSDLAHRVRTAALTRCLLATSRTVRERAFAWGWLTHFLADEAIHPIIGRGVGELLTGCRERFVDGASDMLAHLRVEMGLDAWHAERAPGVRRRRLEHVFGSSGISFLVSAYVDTYGVDMDAGRFLRSHRNATRRVGQALGTMRVLAALMETAAHRVPWALRKALRAAYECDALRSLGLAYVNPVHPSQWLLEEVDAVLREHSVRFLEHYESGAATLRDVNLDTGRPLQFEEELERDAADPGPDRTNCSRSFPSSSQIGYLPALEFLQVRAGKPPARVQKRPPVRQGPDMTSGFRMLRRVTLAALVLPLSVTSLSAQAQTGRVVGQVVDAQTGRPISGAQVMLEGTQMGTLAGVDGRYVIRNAPAGTVAVRALMIGYATKTVTGVAVARGGTAEVNVALEPAAVQLQGITVSAGQERGSVARALNEQRNAVVVMSAITTEEISRSPDSDAAGAVKRVSGVTVQDGKYVFVRGLGERYTTTSLNGARVPSPEPERKVVPLDLFPSGLLQTVTTAKTFTPDLAGDFSGAQVNIQTRSFPTRRQLTFSASTGVNPLVTGKPILFSPGAGSEWLGLAAGNRRLPGEVARFGNFQTVVPTQGDVNRMVSSFRNAWSARTKTGRPKASFSTSLGGSDPLFGQQVGYLLSGTYSYGEEAKVAQRRAQALPTAGGGTAEIDRFEGSSGGRSVLWGGLANVSTLVGTHSRFELNATYNRTADDEARVESGYSENLGQQFQIQRLRYVERSVFSGQLRGEHQFGGAHRLDWSATRSSVRRSEPDRSEFVTQMDSDPSGKLLPPAWFSVSNEGAVRTFGELTESAVEGTASYTFSFGPSGRQSRLKVGGTARATERHASNSAFAISAALDRAGRELRPEEIFDGRFASADSRVFRVTPIAQGGSYAAQDRLTAAYAMLDLALSSSVRVVAGTRLERSEVTVDARSTLGEPVRTSPGYSDLLPSLSVNWTVTPEQTLRLSASQTLSRPEYRELAPVQYREVLGGDNVVGNANLRRSLIQNLDLRWEWYPTPSEAVTVAFFAKDFQDPIERVFLGTSGTRIITFTNAEAAHNFGAELELRKGLGFVSEALETTTFFTNATIMESRIRISRAPTGTFQTASDRPMVGQSPYVVNAGVTYMSSGGAVSATVLYNVAGRRIASAAELPLPSVYEEARHALDLSLRFPLQGGVKAKVDFENVLDAPFEMVQGSVVRERYRTGRRLGFGVTWQP